jgi:hypothetical protein
VTRTAAAIPSRRKVRRPELAREPGPSEGSRMVAPESLESKERIDPFRAVRGRITRFVCDRFRPL